METKLKLSTVYVTVFFELAIIIQNIDTLNIFLVSTLKLLRSCFCSFDLLYFYANENQIEI